MSTRVLGARLFTHIFASSSVKPLCAIHRSMAGISYKAPLKDFAFVSKLVGAEEHYKKMGKTDLTSDFIGAISEECAKLAEDVFSPLYEHGDKEGCHIKDGEVVVPPRFKEAFDKYNEGGWQSMGVPEEYGGQGLPLSLALIKAELLGTANWPLWMYPGLAMGAINTLLLHGSPELNKIFLPKMSDGVWTGTMDLTEPHCGTDLGQVRTKAVPRGDNSYSISGTKIFISCGDHNMAENIIHIVLARLPDAPAGTKGISLFLVPKYLVKSNGELETKKNVTCGGLENKMGIHGSTTAVVNYDESIGYLIGEPNNGLKQMLTFMNQARLGTALQGVGAAELAYQGALPYARERISMRSLSGTKFPDQVADPLIVHPDVRRLLLCSKAVAEGGRAMMFEASLLGDHMMTATTEQERDLVEDDLGLFTPILKGFLTEMGLQATNDCQQVFGGHGYIVDNGMEQLVRDTRISTLYEGTTGIQALDLLGRKILLGGPKPLIKFTKRIFSFAASQISDSEMRPYALQLLKYNAKWLYLTTRIALKARKDRDMVGSASVDFLMYSGYTSMAYYWLRMMVAAKAELKAGATDKDFYTAKLHTGDFYFNCMLPKCDGYSATMLKSSKHMTQMDADIFDAR